MTTLGPASKFHWICWPVAGGTTHQVLSASAKLDTLVSGIWRDCDKLAPLVLRSAFAISAIDFTAAQAIATFVAMTSNFFLNNLFTYRDQRLSGPALIRGLLSFYAICSVGALGNVGIATYIFATDHLWWVAGIAGAFVGSVWNYAVSSVFTWGRR